jgi:hypothetical protein
MSVRAGNAQYAALLHHDLWICHVLRRSPWVYNEVNLTNNHWYMQPHNMEAGPLDREDNFSNSERMDASPNFLEHLYDSEDAQCEHHAHSKIEIDDEDNDNHVQVISPEELREIRAQAPVAPAEHIDSRDGGKERELHLPERRPGDLNTPEQNIQLAEKIAVARSIGDLQDIFTLGEFAGIMGTRKFLQNLDVARQITARYWYGFEAPGNPLPDTSGLHDKLEEICRRGNRDIRRDGDLLKNTQEQFRQSVDTARDLRSLLSVLRQYGGTVTEKGGTYSYADFCAAIDHALRHDPEPDAYQYITSGFDLRAKVRQLIQAEKRKS